MRQSISRLDGEHPLERRRGLLQLALVLEGEAEIVADARVIEPGLQDAAVKSFRLGQSPGALEGKGFSQLGFEGGGWRGGRDLGNIHWIPAQLHAGRIAGPSPNTGRIRNRSDRNRSYWKRSKRVTTGAGPDLAFRSIAKVILWPSRLAL
jgi:hypothetical protein